MNKEELIEKRKSYLHPKEAREVQAELIDIYNKEYKPKHSKAEYFDLIMKYKVDGIRERHCQETNWPDAVYKVFSDISQYVIGFTKEHCLDKIFEHIAKRDERIEFSKTLPTLEELVESDTVIKPKEMYHHSGDGRGNYHGDMGSTIIEMREIGIERFRYENYKSWCKY